jgi:hypothetical protein
MHAVSLIPHAQKIFQTTSKSENHMEKSDGMQKKLKMHAVSLTPHAKYDTACTTDKRFEWPWQPLKGISIKNIYVPELSYPTTTKSINLKGLDTACTIFAFENRSYLGEFEAEFKRL